MLSMLKKMQICSNYDLQLNYIPYRYRNRFRNKKKTIKPFVELQHKNRFFPLRNQKILEKSKKTNKYFEPIDHQKSAFRQTPPLYTSEQSKQRSISEEIMSNDEEIVFNREDIEFTPQINSKRGHSLEEKTNMNQNHSQRSQRQRGDNGILNKFQRKKMSPKPIFDPSQLDDLINQCKQRSANLNLQYQSGQSKELDKQSSDNKLADTTIKSHPKLQDSEHESHKQYQMNPSTIAESKNREKMVRFNHIMTTIQEISQIPDSENKYINIYNQEEHKYPLFWTQSQEISLQEDKQHLNQRQSSVEVTNQLINSFRQCYQFAEEKKNYRTQQIPSQPQGQYEKMIEEKMNEIFAEKFKVRLPNKNERIAKQDNIWNNDKRIEVFQGLSECYNFKDKHVKDLHFPADLINKSTEQSEIRSPSKEHDNKKEDIHKNILYIREQQGKEDHSCFSTTLKKNQKAFYFKDNRGREGSQSPNENLQQEMDKRLSEMLDEEEVPHIWSVSDLLSEDNTSDKKSKQFEINQERKRSYHEQASQSDRKNSERQSNDSKNPSGKRHSNLTSPRDEVVSVSGRNSEYEKKKQFQQEKEQLLNQSSNSYNIKQLSSLRFDPRDGGWNQQTLKEELELFLNSETNSLLTSSQNHMNNSADPSLSSSGFNSRVPPSSFNLQDALREEKDHQGLFSSSTNKVQEQEEPLFYETSQNEEKLRKSSPFNECNFETEEIQPMEVIEQLESNTVSTSSFKNSLDIRSITDYKHHFHPRDQAMTRFKLNNPPLFKLDSSRSKKSSESASPCKEWTREVGELFRKKGRSRNLERFKTRLNKF